RQALGHEGGGVGDVLSALEAHTRRVDSRHPVDPKTPPILPVAIPGEQVPAAGGVDELIRLDVALALPSGGVSVDEAEPLRGLAGTGDRDECPDIEAALGGECR